MAAMTAKQAKAVAERYQKAQALVDEGKVFRLYGERDRYVVVNGQGQAYLVDLVSGECSCPDSQYRCSRLDILCKHALAALIVHEQAQQGAGERAPQPPAAPEPDGDEDFPAAWCQGCGVALESGELCDACAEREMRRIRRDVELAAELVAERRQKADEAYRRLFGEPMPR